MNDLRLMRANAKFKLAVIRWCHNQITTEQLTEAKLTLQEAKDLAKFFTEPDIDLAA